MADKGFDIRDELKKLDLHLSIPPFLKDKVGFEEDMLSKLKQLQGIAYMWRGRSVRSVDFEYSTQSFLYLCLDALIKYGLWLAYFQIFRTQFLLDNTTIAVQFCRK